jgi:predicted RNase H-like nuclease (RuvC/YqgF family)
VVIDTSVTPLPEAVARIRAAMEGDTAHRA